MIHTLNSHVEKQAMQSGYDVIRSDENDQQENDFSSKITGVMSRAFNQGYEQVIIIGNDTPHLNTQHLTQAAQQLKHNDVIIGPSTDGGIYLLGIKKAHYDRNIFENLPWQKAILYRGIIQFLNSKNYSWHTLEPLTDIDSIPDIARVLKHTGALSTAIRRLLLTLSQKRTQINNHIQAVFYTAVTSVLFNKGSPIAA